MTNRARLAAGAGLAVLGVAAFAWGAGVEEKWTSTKNAQGSFTAYNLAAPSTAPVPATAAVRNQDVTPGTCIPKSSGANTLPLVCSTAGVDYENALTVTAPVCRSTNTLSICTNGIGNTQLRQGAALSVVGNATNATANLADIAASGANQFLGTNAAGTALAWTSSIPLTSIGNTSVANVTALEALTGANYRDGSAVYVSSVAADFVLHTTSSVTVDHITIASVSGSSGARWIRRPTPDGFWYQTGTQFYLGGSGASDENNCTAAITPCATAGELRRRLLGRIMPGSATQSFTVNVDAAFAGGDFDPLSFEIDPSRNPNTVITVLGVPTVTAIGTVASVVAHSYIGNQPQEIVVTGYNWSTHVGKIIRLTGTSGTTSKTAVVVADLGTGRARLTENLQNQTGAADFTAGNVVEELTSMPRAMGLRGLGAGTVQAWMIDFSPTGTFANFETAKNMAAGIFASYIGGTGVGAVQDNGRGVVFNGCSFSRGLNFRGNASVSRSVWFNTSGSVLNSVVGRNEWQSPIFVNSTLQMGEGMHTRFHSIGIYNQAAGTSTFTMLDGAWTAHTDAIYGSGNDATATVFSLITRNTIHLGGGGVGTGGIVATGFVNAAKIPNASITIPIASLPYYEDIWGNALYTQTSTDPHKKMAAFTTAGVAANQVMYADSTKTIAGQAGMQFDDVNVRLGVGDVGTSLSSLAGQINAVQSGSNNKVGAIASTHVNNSGANTLGTRLTLRRSDGTFAAPTAVTGGSSWDNIAQIGFAPYDGTNYLTTAIAGAIVTSGATVATGSIPTTYAIAVADGSANFVSHTRFAVTTTGVTLSSLASAGTTYVKASSSGLLSTAATIPYTDITGGPSVNAITSLTTDVVAAGPGAAVATIQANAVGNTKLRDSGALSLMGRSVNTSGDPGDISAVAGSDCVFREGSSTIACGSITESIVTNLVTDLAGKQATGNYITSLTTDVVATGPGAAAATIQADAVTYAKMQNVSAASRILCRGSAGGAGDMQECTAGTGLAISGTTISSTLVGLTDGDKGDIVVSSTGTVWTVDADVVDNTKLANMTAPAFKGRTTAGTGDPEDLTATQATAMLNVFDATHKGLAPAGGATAGSFLKFDGTWAVPAGTGVTSISGTSGRISSTGGTTPVLDLVASGVTPGSYTATDLTVDAYGRITAAANGSGGGGGGGTVTTVTATAPFLITSTPTTTPNVTSSVLTDTLLGRDTAGTGVVEQLAVGGGIEFTGGPGIQRSHIAGDLDVPAGSNTSTLATVGGGAGSCTYCSVTFDAKGRQTAYSSGAAPAPSGATYLTQTTNGTLSAEQAMTSLAASGVMTVNNSTGVVGSFAVGTARVPYGSGSLGGITDSANMQFNGQTFGLTSIQELQIYNASTAALTIAGFRIGTDAAFANSISFGMLGTNWSGAGLSPNGALFELNAGSAPYIFSNYGTGKISFTTTSSRTERLAILNNGTLTAASLGAGGVMYATSPNGTIAASAIPTDRVMVSGGTGSAPYGNAEFAYDSGDDAVSINGGVYLAIYNVGSKANDTNYERMFIGRGGNIYNIRSEQKGTGVIRPIQITSTAGVGIDSFLMVNGAAPATNDAFVMAHSTDNARDHVRLFVGGGTNPDAPSNSLLQVQPSNTIVSSANNGGVLSTVRIDAMTYSAGSTTTPSEMASLYISNATSRGTNISGGTPTYAMHVAAGLSLFSGDVWMLGQDVIVGSGGGGDSVGFFGNGGSTLHVVSGSRGGNVALASLISALAAYGLVVDSTTP